MANKTFYCEEIKAGTYMYWNICAQACNDFTITIKDEITGKNYFSGSKPVTQSGSMVNIGGSGADNFATVVGDNLIIEVSSERSSEIKSSINAYGVNDASGKTVGKGYNICIEDSSDDDYNDLYISIIAWAKQG